MFSRNRLPVQGNAFIVTGGSLGLGRAIAVELAKRGALRILLVARGAGPLTEAQTIVSRAATNSAAQIETFSVDLTDAKAARDAVKAAGLADDSLWTVYSALQALAGLAYSHLWSQRLFPLL